MRTFRASKKYSTRRIKAEDELDLEEDIDTEMDDEEAPTGGVTVDPEATDLVFEAEDVAELVAEITGEEVEVTADSDQVVFTVGEEEYTVEPDGDEEILEASRKVLRGKSRISASRRAVGRRSARPVKASSRPRRAVRRSR